ncbi:MAG TPA: transaldolase [Pirellulales bacterium]
MNKTRPTQKLHDLGQSIWLDNLTYGLLASGTLKRYIDEFSVTGVTSNPTIFYHAIQNSDQYDEIIREKASQNGSVESLLELFIDDIRRAADLFRPVYDATDGIDGWVSLEVSPLLAHDTEGTVAAAKRLHAAVCRPNVFIKIPGTEEGLRAIEESIFAGVPINVTLLFTRKHYVDAAEAYLYGIERRIKAGLDPRVSSVASLFVSRWDVAVRDRVPERLVDRLGTNVAKQTYETYRALMDTPRWQRILDVGAHPQRLLWASTGTKNPEASDIFYITALAAPSTITTMPEKTLKAFADHGEISHILPTHARYCDHVLAEFAEAGIDVDALGAQLQAEGVQGFIQSWDSLLECVASKRELLALQTQVGAAG